MSSGVPGCEQKPEQTPHQVIYRRFASETRTVEVTSTSPWTKETQKEALTMPNASEQLERVLKWTSDQSLLKSDSENGTNSPKNETTPKANQEISSPSEKSSKPVLTLGSNQDKSNIYKPDSTFGGEAQLGRRLSLAQRDKVVGGAAMMFGEPLISRESGHQSERRKSEYDVSPLSSVPFLRCDPKRLTDSKIEEDKMHSFRQSSDKFKTEPKGNSLFSREIKTESDKDKTQSTIPSFYQEDKSTFKTVSQGNSSRSENERRDEPKFEKDKVLSTTNVNCLRPENTRHVEPRIEKNKLQTSSADHKDTVKTESKGKILLRSENATSTDPKRDRDRVLNTSNGLSFNAQKDKITFQNDCKSDLYGESFSSEDKTKIGDGNKKKTVTESSNMTEPEKTCFNRNYDKVTLPHHSENVKMANEKSLGANSHAYSLDKTKPSNVLGSQVTTTKDSVQTSYPKNQVANSQAYSLDKTNPSEVLGSQTTTTKDSVKTSYPKNQVASSQAYSLDKTKPSEVLSSQALTTKDSIQTSYPKSRIANSQAYSLDKTKPSEVLGSQTTTTKDSVQTSYPKNQVANSHAYSLDKTKPSEVLGSQTTTTKDSVQTSYPKSQLANSHAYSLDKTKPSEVLGSEAATTRDSVQTSNPKSQVANPQAYSLGKTKPSEVLGSHITKTNDSVLTSSAGTSKHSDLVGRRPSLENIPDIIPGKDLPFHKTQRVPETQASLDTNTSSPKSPRCSLTSKNDKPDPGDASTTRHGKGTTAQTKSLPEKNTDIHHSLLSAQRPSTSRAATVVHSIPVTTAQQKVQHQNRCTIETEGSQSSGCPPKESQACCGTRLAVRPVTRSKSDVGEGNKGRPAPPTTRKSCAERRCCGGRQRPSQEAAPARARSLSRVLPMGSSASLSPQNKSSWTTQRALEAEVQQLKRELQMHKAEELRLNREIHKLRSVLQQATSFGEETAGTTGDPDDGALLVSLQESHGMAGAAGVGGGASKKQGVSGESCEPESTQVPHHEKDMRSRQLIKAAILDNDFLKNLARCQIRELVDCMYPQRVQKGSYVIREGEAGSHLYVLDEGEMEVLKEGTVLGRMGPGKAFGELAILYNCTRTASIRAVSDLQVWVLDRRAFQQIMMRTGMQRMEDNLAFLRSVPLLKEINEQTVARIADALEPEFYPAGEYIVRQGARGNTFFIISSGSVEVTQRGPHGDEVVLRTLERGDYFGEQALLHDDCRTASVRALPPGVDCLTLDRESFNALIGSLSELHNKDYAEDTRSQTSRTSFTNACRKEEEAVASLRLEDLHPLGTLGVGGFGCVRLVMAPSGRSYALKCLSKRHVSATGQQEHVAAERDVLLAARSPFIVRLFRTFRDDANVYLLLEACLGGEVWALLRDHERLTDKAARFVAACVLEALEYLHARSIVYRDLKPENLVMDANGYVKLVDFGFCKRLPGGCKTWTFCGTPEYVAPEVILNRGHDRAVDYWALGVLIYELLTGAPPFAATDPMGTYKLILMGMESAIMPKYVSRPAAHLIRRLCRAAPSERIGYQRGGFREVKAHRWFQDLDWDALRAQTMTPPIKPQVSGPTDMSNFYPQTLDEELAPTELSHWDADF